MKVWSLFSGGKDSTACTQWLDEQGILAGIVALDTGISTLDWMQFIEAQANTHNWNLEVFKTPASYDDLVLKYGFPGPGAHGMFMNYLKGRGVRQFKRKYKSETLASGVRKAESARRFTNTKEWSFFEGVKVWAPIFEWSTEKVWQYLRERNFKRSPAYQTLCISGDCLCGAFATEMERAAIRAFYPDVSERLSRLESITGKQWGWAANKGKRKMSPVCIDCDLRE